jgi:hypothetical protein
VSGIVGVVGVVSVIVDADAQHKPTPATTTK